MRAFLLALGFSLFLTILVVHPRPVRAQAPVQKPAEKSDTPSNALGIVRTAMKNVDFHLTDTIVVHIAALEGKLAPDNGGVPVFDDKSSFHLEVDSASIQVQPQAMTNALNEYVFAKPGAPLKKLALTIQGNDVVLKGILANKGGISFETEGTMAATPDGQIRVHTLKVKAFHLPVKGLMDMLGLDTAGLIDTSKISGVAVDKDDLILDPELLLPPPKMHGHLSSIQIQNGLISMVFGAPGRKETIASRCGGRNFQSFRGGTVRFGKLTMNDTDLELVDADPADPFDFSIDHYMDQLVAGYSKMTKQGGLCAHVSDYNKLPPHGPQHQTK
jgi:hypothetical protein